ncbi:MAG: prolipoprotein diacylglyceryl transferase [Endomicrobium sp.]|jgi:phosphatidylglycerol:prolipoprotein diacylglycerol transferase|nr:prolipoprotein diacylglyceryl transferase [Endomicrobium sp.]
MYPILFSIGKFTFFSYGFFLNLSFIVAILYIFNFHTVKLKMISDSELFYLCLYIIFIGIFGSRFFFIIINLKDFYLRPMNIFKLWNGGFVYYGGFIFVTFFLKMYAFKKKINLFKLFNFFSPALALGHSIGRVGCFFAGCCYGKESNLPWAVVFNNKNSLAVTGINIHPTQLYESFGNFLVFLLLHFFSKKKTKLCEPYIFYLVSYAILRFIIEFFRGDHINRKCFGLSISQIISIFLFIIGILILCKQKLYIIKKSQKSD